MGFFSKIKNLLEGASDQGREKAETKVTPENRAELAKKGYENWCAAQKKTADETQRKRKHLDRFKASEIPLKTRHNGLCVPGDWAWLDFYDNGVAILTYETIFDMDNELTPEDVAPMIREDWEEQRGVHRRCYNFHMRSEDEYVLKIDLNYYLKNEEYIPCNHPISYLKYDGNVLSKLSNRYLTPEEKKTEWIDSMFAHYPKFIKTHLSDCSKGDAVKIKPTKKEREEEQAKER